MTRAEPIEPRMNRIVASPYARRLARERGVALAGLRGSGPGGRIVARDVGERAASPTIEVATVDVARDQPGAGAANPAVQPAPARPVGAFATTLDSAPAAALIDPIEAANPTIGLDDVLIKAIAYAMARTDLGATAIVWREAGGDTVLAGADRLTLGRLAAARSGAGLSEDAASAAPRLLVSRIREAGVRPIQAPLAPDHAMRLTLVGTEEGPIEALLTFDDDLVPESSAARILTLLRDGLAAPLRLLV